MIFGKAGTGTRYSALDKNTQRARGTVEAARRLYSLLSRHPEFTSEEDFNLVRAIESQTDDLPLGQVRDLWDPVVLAEKDAELVRCEAL